MPDAATGRASAEISRDQFVAAARRCFARDGVAATRMEDVAQEARLSRQYLYRLIPTRDQLITHAIAARASEFTDDLEHRARTRLADLELTEAFIDQITYAVALGRHDPEFVTLAAALPRAQINHALTASDSPFHEFTRRAFQPLFLRAMEAGSLRTDVSVKAIVDWLQGVQTLVASRDDLDADAERALFRDFALRGVLVDP